VALDKVEIILDRSKISPPFVDLSLYQLRFGHAPVMPEDGCSIVKTEMVSIAGPALQLRWVENPPRPTSARPTSMAGSPYRPPPIGSGSATRSGSSPATATRPPTNLYDWYVCGRGSRVEQLWPITARGAVF
jgi:hypothetical protein